ncbi:IclR family transcriptional regulator [Porticoccus sp. GXU_MW_L64]
MANRETQKYKTPALDKGLDILELLCQEKTPMAMNDIANSLGRTRSEIFRMVSTLEQRGYIYRREESDRFMLTIKLFEMGINHPPNRSLQEVALPLMRQLSTTTDQCCYLAVAQFEHIITIANMEAPGYLGFSVRMGHQEQIVPTAAGHVMFAYLPEDVQGEWLERFKSFEDDDFNSDVYKRRAKKIRATGYEIRPNNKIAGVTDICAPILDPFGDRAIASLVIPFIKHLTLESEKEVATARLVETATQISDTLKFAVLKE